MFTARLERAIREPEFAIKVAGVTAVSIACATTVVVLLGLVWPSPWTKLADIYSLLDVVLILGLAYGLLRRSRACAALLLVYWAGTRIQFAVRLQKWPGGIAFFVGFIFLLGTKAAFSLHRPGSQSKEDRYEPPAQAT